MSNTSDTTPLPPEQDPLSAIVARLDPDLAAAYRSGNTAIIQAVNNGMTTSEMIVKELIRTGVSMVGLPPGVQQLVTERQKEMDAQREAENAQLRRMAAGMAGVAMMGSNVAEGGMYYEGDKAQAQRDAAIKQYEENRLSANYWSEDFYKLMLNDPKTAGEVIKKEQDTNKKDTATVKTKSEELQKAIDAAEDFKKEALAQNPKSGDLRAFIEQIDAGTDPLATFVGPVQPEVLDKVFEYKRLKIEADEARILCGSSDCSNPKTNPALKLLAQQKDLLQKLEDANKGADFAKKKEATDAYAAFVGSNHEFLQALQKDDVKEAYKIAAAQDKAAPPAGAQADMRGQTDAYLAEKCVAVEASMQFDGTGAKAAVKAELADGGFGDEDTPARPGSIAANTLGAGPESKLAQLGAPQEAANDPPVPIPEQQRPKVASMSQGMGA